MDDATNGAGKVFDPAAFASGLTHRPGVYRMLDGAGRVIYVGKARDLKRRVASYFSGRAMDAKTMAMVKVVANIEVTVTRTEAEALLLEYNLIKEHRPRYNVLLRDDKSYPFIRVSTEQTFPRISFYRGARPKAGRIFGPYPNAGAVRSTVNLLQKLFQLRSCEDSYFRNRSRPCMQYQIERCSAPCVGLISEEDYARDVEDATRFLRGQGDAVIESIASRMEAASAAKRYELAAQYRDQLAKLQATRSEQLVARAAPDFDVIALARDGGTVCVTVLFFRGGRLLGSRNHFPQHAGSAPDAEVMRAFVLQYYGGRESPPEILLDREIEEAEALAAMFSERSARKVGLRWRLRGDRARWVGLAATNAAHGAAQRSRSQESIGAQLEALREALDLDAPPERIECFDISHTAGEATVGSCVVFGSEGPLKSAYRRFNITGVEPGDDYAAMREVLSRRFKPGADPESLPDLVLVDGGKGQLAAAARVMGEGAHEGITLVGVAKGEGRKPGRERLYVHRRAQPVRLPGSSAALHLIQQVRDEAHRFALAGHRGRRQKKLSRSTLEDISGLGPKRRQALLRQFGGLQAIARAGVDDLARVKGISRQLAESIYDSLHAD
ncbi:MAG TPA: excinuclease ABC subunit UvrC [Gammaproteobacteria bacterium]|nr:excinuclease ABC subunit UvrC [Gammaproteobacteria bacterium]